MGYAAILGIVVGVWIAHSCSKSAEQAKAEAPKIQYLTNGYLCNKMYNGKYGAEVRDCEEVMTGKKVEVIHNPSNIFEVK